MKLSLGRYVPYQSPIHKVDARIKIFVVILLMVCIFLNFQGWAISYTLLGVVGLIVLVLLLMTRTSPLRILSSLKSLWFMIILLLLVYSIMPTAKPTLALAFEVKQWHWKVYWDSFAQAGKILLRLILMIQVTMILTSSTKPLDLTYALEWYMTPLKIFHFPAHEVAMTISIALRFIPTLLEDTTRIMKAQESRGVNFTGGRIFKRFGALVSLIIPLFVSSFMRSEELANAMECRGYDPRGKRTRYRINKFRFTDFAFLFIFILLAAGYITLRVTNFDFYAWMGVNVL